MTEEQRICLAIWRKAAANPSTFTVKLSTKASAQTVKRTLYRVIRPYRDNELYDPVLTAACQQLIPAIREALPTGWEIYFSARKTLHELHSQLSLLGITDEDIMSEEELEAKRSLERLTAPPVEKPNPFYDRSKD